MKKMSMMKIRIAMITGKKDNSSDKNKISYNYKCII